MYVHKIFIFCYPDLSHLQTLSCFQITSSATYDYCELCRSLGTFLQGGKTEAYSYSFGGFYPPSY